MAASISKVCQSMAGNLLTYIKVMNAVSLALFVFCCLHLSIHSKAAAQEGAITVVPQEDNGDVTVEVNGDEEEGTVGDKTQHYDMFIPTHEWQTVNEGQAIPPGLHVRMSLQTGQKEAKLMDGDSGIKYQKTPDNQEGMANKDKKHYSVDELKRALKDFKTTKFDEADLQREADVKAKYRSYEELKKDFEDINMNIETDGEIVTRLVDLLKEPQLDRDTQIGLLKDLEYYLHQIDNAILFKDLGGLPSVLKAVNTSKDEEVQIEAAMVLGTASSLNPQVQVAAIEAGALQILLPILSTSSSVNVQRKVVFALSAVCRHFPHAQKRFLDLGGLSTLQKLMTMEGSTEKIKIKVLTFVTDFIQEKTHIESEANQGKEKDLEKLRQYQQMSLKETMVEQGWCEMIPKLLYVTDHESREQVLLSMKLLGTSCKEHFLSAIDVLRDIKSEYTELARAEAEEGDLDLYFTQLLSVVNDLIKTFKTKDEL